MSVVPERDDRPVTLPPTCAACGTPTARVVRDAPSIHACGYHGGVEPGEVG